jgi:FMN reductase
MSIKMTYLINKHSNNTAAVEHARSAAIRLLAVDGSPDGGGRTRTAIGAVAAAAADAGALVATVALVELDGIDQVLAGLDEADAIVLGAPVYRAAAAAPLKQLLDRIPRDVAERRSPLAGKAVAIVHTGASPHHFLALDGLRNVLAGFFAAHVVPPGLYVPREGFDDERGGLRKPYAEQARAQGAALVELADVLRTSKTLAALRPHA